MSYPIAETILKQLGGNRFMVMTGVIVAQRENGLLLTLRRNKSSANRMKITLNDKDLYDIHLIRVNSKYINLDDACKVLKVSENVPVENLRRVFTDMTGLYTSLKG